MKEALIFFLIFLVVFVLALVVFNGRFIYAQIKYNALGIKQLTTSNEQRTVLLNRLIIPKLGVDTPIVSPESTDEFIIQKSLEQGVVLYPDSNIILGHSSAFPWYQGNYGSVFSLLNRLEKGDEIIIFSKEKEYTYQAIEKQIKLPKDLNIENQEDIFYLVSCWPINTDWKRIVVKVQLLTK